MNESYVECLVKKKTSTAAIVGKYTLYILAFAFFILSVMNGLTVIPLLLAVIIGVIGYFVTIRTDLEYEYLYLDKELTIDKVMAKTSRKRVAVYQLDRMEILAPIKSYHLDDYRNRTVTVKDYSIGYEDQPDRRYCMYYEGGVKLILSPSPEMIKMMKNVAPRKVFEE